MFLLLMNVSTKGLSNSTATYRVGGGEIKHVIIIMEENKPYSSIVNSSEAPYQSHLIQQYALAGNYFSPEHPSLPNYIDITAGSDMGITTDCSPSASCQITGSMTNIADLLNSSNLSWKEYAESMPSPCYKSNGANYLVRHNPFVYYTDITENSTYCDQHVVPMNITTGAGFIYDLRSGNLPSFSFITPNLCNDGHYSCSNTLTQVQQIDQWLSILVPKIVNSSEFASTALFIVYDEGSTATQSSQVACILVSPFARTGYVSKNYYTHFSLLATVENIFGLGNLGKNDAISSTMSDLFAQPSEVQSNSSSSSYSQTYTSSTIQLRQYPPQTDAVILIVTILVLSLIAVLAVMRKRLRRNHKQLRLRTQNSVLSSWHPSIY